jgi:ferredoxin-type protein NapF
MVSRRSLLTGVLSSHRVEFSPPWAVSASRFESLCTQCGDCIDACPQHILKRGDKGYPVVNFADSGCTFCVKCANACQTGSLSLIDFIAADPWSVKAQVTEFCVNYSGVVCQMCAGSCPENAIRFVVQAGAAGNGIPVAKIDHAGCTGCGFCQSACPKNAIDVKPL